MHKQRLNVVNACWPWNSSFWFSPLTKVTSTDRRQLNLYTRSAPGFQTVSWVGVSQYRSYWPAKTSNLVVMTKASLSLRRSNGPCEIEIGMLASKTMLSPSRSCQTACVPSRYTNDKFECMASARSLWSDSKPHQRNDGRMTAVIPVWWAAIPSRVAKGRYGKDKSERFLESCTPSGQKGRKFSCIV